MRSIPDRHLDLQPGEVRVLYGSSPFGVRKGVSAYQAVAAAGRLAISDHRGILSAGFRVVVRRICNQQRRGTR